MIDPDHLNIFLIAAETLNFSRTAERLNLSQPSITQNIRALEKHFGAPLFERTGRKLALTEAGLALIPLARQMVAVSHRTDVLMEALKGDIHGHLHIGCSTTPGKYILPVLLAEFMRQHPRVQATCNVTSRGQAMHALEQGNVSIAFSSTPDEFNENIEFRKFISDPVVLIAPGNHPWSALGGIDVEELKKTPIVMREPTAGTYRVVRLGLANLGVNIEALRIILTLGNSEAIAIAVQQGLGVGFISRTVIQHNLCGNLSIIKVHGLELYQDIYICQHRLHPMLRVQAAFWDYATNPNNPILQNLSNEIG